MAQLTNITTTGVPDSRNHLDHMNYLPMDNDSVPQDSFTGGRVRALCRSGCLTTTTSGLAPTYLQANLIILPSLYAKDFRLLCARNPVPCPLLAESRSTGSYDTLKSYMKGVEGEKIASSLDLRVDVPKYVVYEDGQLVQGRSPSEEHQDIVGEWTEDHVAFLIGCSFSFESALSESGLTPRHIIMDQIVPVYRTIISLCKSGVFDSGTYLVSMRPYKRSEIETVRDITRPYSMTHGEPIAWGWDAIQKLGIKDIDSPEWGSPPLTEHLKPLGSAVGDEDNIPVFWGCGVTPQEAVMRAGIKGKVMAHAAGHMLVLDCRDWDIVETEDIGQESRQG